MRTCVLFVGLLIGCNSREPSESPIGDGRPVGRTCTETLQCADGLECLAQPSTEEWCDQESYCSLDCTLDEQCVAALGDGHICVDWCGASLCFEGSSG